MNEIKRTVMIVEDEASILESFSDFFEDRLWNTLLAESGEEALLILETEIPQGAIVDIRMGGMDGNAFIREALKMKPNMVFVICTGSPEYDTPKDLLELPRVSSHIFRKPIASMFELEAELIRLIDSMETDKT